MVLKAAAAAAQANTQVAHRGRRKWRQTTTWEANLSPHHAFMYPDPSPLFVAKKGPLSTKNANAGGAKKLTPAQLKKAARKAEIAAAKVTCLDTQLHPIATQ